MSMSFERNAHSVSLDCPSVLKLAHQSSVGSTVEDVFTVSPCDAVVSLQRFSLSGPKSSSSKAVSCSVESAGDVKGVVWGFEVEEGEGEVIGDGVESRLDNWLGEGSNIEVVEDVDGFEVELAA